MNDLRSEHRAPLAPVRSIAAAGDGRIEGNGSGRSDRDAGRSRPGERGEAALFRRTAPAPDRADGSKGPDWPERPGVGRSSETTEAADSGGADADGDPLRFSVSRRMRTMPVTAHGDGSDPSLPPLAPRAADDSIQVAGSPADEPVAADRAGKGADAAPVEPAGLDVDESLTPRERARLEVRRREAARRSGDAVARVDGTPGSVPAGEHRPAPPAPPSAGQAGPGPRVRRNPPPTPPMAPASRPAKRRDPTEEPDEEEPEVDGVDESDDDKFPWHHQFNDDEPAELQAKSPLLSRAFRSSVG